MSGCERCTPVANSTGIATCTTADNSQVDDCAPGFHQVVCGEADTCVANTCTAFGDESAVPGYVLPSCSAFTTGSIECSELPQCADGYYGTPIATCDNDGDELALSGCTACDGIPNSAGGVTCSGLMDSAIDGCAAEDTDSQADACAAGYHLIDLALRNCCSSPAELDSSPAELRL